MRQLLRRSLLSAALLTGLAFPGQAVAKDYCVQNGMTTAPVACPASFVGATAFSLQDVAAVVKDDDTVRIEPGTYPAFAFGGRTGVRFFGDPDQARPVITSQGGADDAALWINQNASGTVLRHLTLKQVGAATSNALRGGTQGGAANSDVVLEDVSIESTGKCAVVYGALTATDVVAASTGADCIDLTTGSATTADVLTRVAASTSVNATALTTSGASFTLEGSALNAPAGVAAATFRGSADVRRTMLAGGSRGIIATATALTVASSTATAAAADGTGALLGAATTATLRNVTVVAPGASGVGVEASSGTGPTTSGARVELANAIVLAAGQDVVADPARSGCFMTIPGTDPPMTIPQTCLAGVANVRRSNVRLGTGGATDKGGNQGENPLFEAPSDLRLQAGSPAVDAGEDVPAGDTDLAGNPRPAPGTKPDLGAYERAAPAPAPVPTTPAQGTLPNSLTINGTAFAPAPLPPRAPGNAFTIRTRTIAKDGTIRLGVFVPGPGMLSAVASVSVPKGRSFTTVVVKRGSAKPARSGLVTLTLKPNAAARKALAKARNRRVALRLSFVPTGGTEAVRTAALTARKAARKAKRAARKA